MSEWRRRAYELFPDIREEIKEDVDPDSTYTLFGFHLLPRVREAHEKNDIEELKKIYGYA